MDVAIHKSLMHRTSSWWSQNIKLQKDFLKILLEGIYEFLVLRWCLLSHQQSQIQKSAVSGNTEMEVRHHLLWKTGK